MSTPMGLLRRGWKMVVAESTSDTQMVTPLPSQTLMAFSAPTIELRYWLLVQLQSTCWRVGKKWEIIYRHLHRLSFNPSGPQLSCSRPDDPGLQSSLAKLTAQFTVSLQWVPAHVGLTGNEKADRLAKIGSQAPQTQNPVTYREAKTLLHSWYNGDWKKQNSGYQAHLDPIWRLERAQQTTIFHLRTGHCGLSAHLKRIGISDTSLCECGQADQIPGHVLQSCPKYAERCQLTRPQVLIWRPSCRARQKTSTGRLVLWHQPDWRSDLHGCWSLKKKNRTFQSEWLAGWLSHRWERCRFFYLHS